MSSVATNIHRYVLKIPNLYFIIPWANDLFGRILYRIDRELSQYKVIVLIKVRGRPGLESVTFCTIQAQTRLSNQLSHDLTQ